MPDFNNTEIAQHAFLVLRRASRTPVPSDAIDELELYVTEIEKMLKESTGYLPSAYGDIHYQKAARFYAAWQYLASDEGNADSANKLKRLFDEAQIVWARVASAEANIHHFNNFNERRRTQDFSSPNMSRDDEVAENTLRWNDNSVDHTEDLFSKPPVVADQTASTTTVTPVVCFTPSSDATDPEGRLDATSVEVITGPQDGSVSINATTGVTTYTADAGFTGTDVFTLRILDDDDKETAFKVTVTVSA
jgi:hypothetical protein